MELHLLFNLLAPSPFLPLLSRALVPLQCRPHLPLPQSSHGDQTCLLLPNACPDPLLPLHLEGGGQEGDRPVFLHANAGGLC